jgi:hypothetical protein
MGEIIDVDMLLNQKTSLYMWRHFGETKWLKGGWCHIWQLYLSHFDRSSLIDGHSLFLSYHWLMATYFSSLVT